MGHEALADFIAGLPPPMDTHGGYEGTQLSKRIRSELAAAVKAGVFPVGTTFSVRKDHHKSYRVDITEWPTGAVFTEHYVAWRMEQELTGAKDARGNLTASYKAPDQADSGTNLVWRNDGWRPVYDVRCTDAVNDAIRDAKSIADRHNYNNSDPMTDYFDVGYYLTVDAGSVVGAAEQGLIAECSPEFAELLRRAQDAANAVGDACTAAVLGRRGFQGACRYRLDELIRIADRANGRPVAYDKRRRGWFPVEKQRLGARPGTRTLADVADSRTAELTRAIEAAEARRDTPARADTRYFRCFARGRNVGDTPIVKRDGRTYAADGSYGLIEAIGNGPAIEIESVIVSAIDAGKRGGTVKRGAHTVHWTLV